MDHRRSITIFHGLTSLLLVASALTVGVVAMFRRSPAWGAAALFVSFLAFLAILFFFCARCPCKEQCAHVLPGKAAGLLFGGRRVGSYGALDLAATILAILLLFGFPHFALWRLPGLLIAYWALIITAAIQIRSFVCASCANEACPMKPRLRR